MRKEIIGFLVIAFLLFFTSILYGEQPIEVKNEYFQLKITPAGIVSLRNAGDPFETEFLKSGFVLGDMVIHYRVGNSRLKQARTDRLSEQRQVKILTASKNTGKFYEVEYIIPASGSPALKLKNYFSFEDQGLHWSFTIENLTSEKIEIGDLAIPLVFNNGFGEDSKEIMEKRAIKHHFISGYGSFLYWMRPNGQGSILVMVPDKNTKLEYFEFTDQVRDVERNFYCYIHSAIKGGLETRGTWRQPHTSLALSPAGSTDSQLAYGFFLKWAKDINSVRDILYESGLYDVRVIPGMTVPVDLKARLAIRSKTKPILQPEFPDLTEIKYLGEKQPDTRFYELNFKKLGENYLILMDKLGRKTYLEFFVTEPLETLVKKRAAFLVSHQQHRNPDKWYNGLFSQWDMRNKVLRSPDDTDGFDGWWGYVIACDDPVLGKAPFIALKNIFYPEPREIEAVEYYLKNYVWGKLQRTDQEQPYPFGIYGVPNWFENRNSIWGFDSNGQGQEHIWRTFDYPHLIALYFYMYQVSEHYPQLVHYLSKKEYLERAYGTARAYFEYPSKINPWYEVYKWGCYNELIMPDLIKALEKEGYPEQASWLRQEWEKKVKYFIYDDPYPFRSEYSFDTTAFESSYAFAKYAWLNPMKPDKNLWYDKKKQVWYSHPVIKLEDVHDYLGRQLKANLACRGLIEPTFYHLGSDLRGESGRYQLSYMSQMGGWAILDQALNFEEDPFELIRLGYASYLSSWALMNTGTPETNFGYWYPGKENDGASGWAFEPRKYGTIWIRKEMGRGVWFYDGEIDLGYTGALRAAATIAMDDPIFGLVALGGKLEEKGKMLEIVPQDGLRQRFYFINKKSERLLVTLDGVRFKQNEVIVLNPNEFSIKFKTERNFFDEKECYLKLQSTMGGKYEVIVDHKKFSEIDLVKNVEREMKLIISEREALVEIRKKI